MVFRMACTGFRYIRQEEDVPDGITAILLPVFCRYGNFILFLCIGKVVGDGLI